MTYEYLTNTGVIVPDTSEILLEVQNEYKALFGQDLVVTPDTPQGMLITAEALARTDVVNNNAALANQINPNVAGGVFLDAIMQITGLQRSVATKTVVPSVTLTGVPGTIISSGTRAATVAGDEFQTLTTVVLDSGGQASVNFAAVEDGAISVLPNTLTQIVTSVLGWETVTNPTAGVLGSLTQSDQQARALRNNTLAFQGVALVEAITSALYAVEGVKSLSFLENTAATTEVIEGITMIPHSVYACVDGGSDEDVAAALLENKSCGAGWNGAEIVSIIEPASGQTYSVKFDRPDEIGILVRVTSPNGDPDSIIDAVLQYASNDVPGLTGFAVGEDVSPFEIAAAINLLYPSTFITKVEISLVSPISYTTDNIVIAIDEKAFTQSDYITVVA